MLCASPTNGCQIFQINKRFSLVLNLFSFCVTSQSKILTRIEKRDSCSTGEIHQAYCQFGTIDFNRGRLLYVQNTGKLKELNKPSFFSINECCTKVLFYFEKQQVSCCFVYYPSCVPK